MLRNFSILFAAVLLSVAVMAAKPAVLFYGSVHREYVMTPLLGMGFEIDVCPTGKLADFLKTDKYNVVVVNTTSDAERTALDAFIARGGGVFVSNPEGYWHVDTWGPSNEWLTKLGAKPRWELLQDSDKTNLYRDIMGCQLSYSTNVTAPVNDGVRGVLTLTWNSTTGVEPPMSFDFSPDWNVVVRGATTHKTTPEKRNDVPLQPWIPKEPVTGSPALLGIRSFEKGRIALFGIRSQWLFTAPGNCPTTEAMLTAGAAGKPSDWLKVIANTFNWLAEPSLKAGLGGAITPDSLLNPPVYKWDKANKVDWSKSPDIKDIPDQTSIRGLIGARTSLSTGKGVVADYVKAAKDAKLNYIVFLEDSLAMDQAKWDQLVADCKTATDDTFAAIPGLTYEDAQGNHLYAFADNVRFPKPEMLFDDKRLKTTQSMRSRVYFDYVNELIAQKAITGFWNHRANMLPVVDYKLYNSFPLYSFDNGRQIDNAFGDYLYLQSTGGCQAPLAFEFVSDPTMVAKRAVDGWTVVSYNNLKDLQTIWHRSAFSFSGSGAQYVTNGPKIDLWQSPNRLAEPRGEWWRPDMWEYRTQLRVSSDVGLKMVTLYDGDRQVLRRWMPTNEKKFEQEIIMTCSQQIGQVLVVEDIKGHKAVSAAFWSRNLNNEEFFCTDRCNFLGNARLRTRTDGQTWTQVSFRANMGITPSKGILMLQAAPALGLSPSSPTLPIDGAPAGFPTQMLDFYPRIPGELPNLYCYPQTYMVSPEIGIGQADILMAYDPLETGFAAKVTPLGHPYDQRQEGYGNSWGSWHRLVPTQKIEGFARIYAATWLTEGFRIGGYEANLRVKSGIEMPEKGLTVTQCPGELWKNGEKIGTSDTQNIKGDFSPGVILILQHLGGAVVLMGTGGNLTYEYSKGMLTVYYQTTKFTLLPGDVIKYNLLFAGAGGQTKNDEIINFARQFGVLTPGTAGYKPIMTAGKTISNYCLWNVDAMGKSVQAKIAKTVMPGFLTACIDGLNDKWSVYLLDKARTAPNFRALPIRDGRAWAQLDLNIADSDLFLGHPVTADNADITLSANWKLDKLWCVEVHNTTNKEITTVITSTPGWTPFTFKETVTLAPGTSKIWNVKE